MFNREDGPADSVAVNTTIGGVGAALVAAVYMLAWTGSGVVKSMLVWVVLLNGNISHF
jgi:hypothetical protein